MDKKVDSVLKNGIKSTLIKDYEWFKNQATIDYDSEQGIKILDDWVNRWIETFKQIHKEHYTIICDISGGMDSRVILVLLLLANVKDKTLFYTRPLEKQDLKKKDDWKIVQILKEKFNLRLVFNPFKSYTFPRVLGIFSTFKTRKKYTDMDINSYNKEFQDIYYKWVEEHPNCDEFDKRQILWELTFNQWHDSFKYERENKNKICLCPFMDLDIKQLKNKGYGLWKFFMKRYYPQMLEIEVEGRGFITDNVVN